MIELIKEIKTLTKLRIIGSILSFPIWILVFAFINASFNYITIISYDYFWVRILLCGIVFFSNMFIWMTYDKEKG